MESPVKGGRPFRMGYDSKASAWLQESVTTPSY